MRATRLLRDLRAVRRYAPRPIPDDVLADILEVARWTGSAKNTQPWDVVLVRDRASLERLAALGPYAGHLRGAAAAVVLVMRGATLSTAFDAGRLAQSVMLAAWAHGVGSCIGSLYPDENERAAKDLLGVPQERWLHTTVALGYPADADARRVSTGTANIRGLALGRRPLDDVVHHERFHGQPSRS